MSAPRNAVQGARGGRLYKWGDEQFVSVTTLLGAISKPSLTSWAARSVAEWAVDNLAEVKAVAAKDRDAAVDLLKGSPWRQRNRAADLGTAVHERIEAYILNKPVPEAPAELAGHMAQFDRFVNEFEPTFELAEATVFSRRWGYAGTLDSIAVVGGERLLLDVKTGKDVYPEAALQLACYRHAEFVGLPDGSELPVPAVDGAAVLHIVADDYRLLPVDCDDSTFRVALYALQLWRWQDEGSKTCIGAPAAPRREEVVV